MEAAAASSNLHPPWLQVIGSVESNPFYCLCSNGCGPDLVMTATSTSASDLQCQGQAFLLPSIDPYGKWLLLRSRVCSGVCSVVVVVNVECMNLYHIQVVRVHYFARCMFFFSALILFVYCIQITHGQRR